MGTCGTALCERHTCARVPSRATGRSGRGCWFERSLTDLELSPKQAVWSRPRIDFPSNQTARIKGRSMGSYQLTPNSDPAMAFPIRVQFTPHGSDQSLRVDGGPLGRFKKGCSDGAIQKHVARRFLNECGSNPDLFHQWVVCRGLQESACSDELMGLRLRICVGRGHRTHGADRGIRVGLSNFRKLRDIQRA
jgi:hypothetical protein